jgi:amino acid efflux transporter
MSETAKADQLVGDGHQKTVTVFSAVALYVASVLGGGILVLPGLTAAAAGAGALIAWVAVSVICLPIALMFGKLSAAIPDAGGASTFVRRALGDVSADLTGWLYFWVIPFGQPAVMLSGLFYAQFALGLSHSMTFAVAWAILVGAGLLNISGTRVSARVQSAVTSSIIFLLLVTIVVSIPHMSRTGFDPVLPHGWSAVGAAAALIMWAYVGWENVSSIAEEFHNPRRDFVVSVVLSMIVIGGLYAGVTAVVLGVLPQGSPDSSTAPLAAVLSISLGSWASWVAALVAVLIVLGSATAIIWGTSSLGASLARTGSLPAKLSERNSRGSFQRSVLLLLTCYTVVLVVMYFDWVSIEDAAKIVGGSAVITYGLCAIAYIRLVKPQRAASWIPPLVTGAFVATVLPFFGWSLLAQLAIVLAYFLLRAIRKKGRANVPG